MLFMFSSCSHVSYLVENGLEQWKIFNRSKPVDEVLSSPYTTVKVRDSIQVVQKAKAFAVSDLGLSATKNYENFVQLDGPCVVWAISAADPLELKESKWNFPIVGEVPYLGFFKKTSAEREIQRLKAENATIDTWTRCVPAFSSLGWFSDPLYSSMLQGKERDIVELVVHESLHATVWVGDSVDFNEKLASFVGLEGSVRYAEKFGGKNAAVLARQEIRGEKLFGDFLSLMESRYKERVRTLEDKKAFYATINQEYERFLAGKRKEGIAFEATPARMDSWNNAAFLAYLNYFADYSVFEGMLSKCAGDLRRFVGWIVHAQDEHGKDFTKDPEEFMRGMSGSADCPANPK